jgi:ribonuclease P protein component
VPVVLPATARLNTAGDFASVVRSGRRAGTRHLVVHLLRSDGTGDRSPRAGFVVSKKVGNAVIRHRVTRRLRPLVREQLTVLPDGTDLVIRALPAAAEASSAQLSVDLNAGIATALRKAGVPRTSS